MARFLVMGVGSFASSAMKILKEEGAEVHCYLNRDYAHYSPASEGKTFYYKESPNPCEIIRKNHYDLVIPMSIDWHQKPWTEELLSLKTPILSPIKDAMLLERDRFFARQLCHQLKIPVPIAHVVNSPEEALDVIHRDPRPYVIKNPLCSPTSPIHTILCETVQDTISWLNEIDYAEGAFLQEYMGRREVGHIAFVSGGEIYPMVTNQEYKRAFDGNMGPVAGAPLGGLVEADTTDKYGLVKQLMEPLLPWFRETGFSGPVQATAVMREQKWHVIEYNVRTGVTTGPALWRMLNDPVGILLKIARNEKLSLAFRPGYDHACILTLAGWGYPYTKIQAPKLEIIVNEPFDCDVWWNEVEGDENGKLFMSGHRIADLVAFGGSMDKAISVAYENIKKIYCLSSYYRLDVGKSLWPPGSE